MKKRSNPSSGIAKKTIDQRGRCLHTNSSLNPPRTALGHADRNFFLYWKTEAGAGKLGLRCNNSCVDRGDPLDFSSLATVDGNGALPIGGACGNPRFHPRRAGLGKKRPV